MGPGQQRRRGGWPAALLPGPLLQGPTHPLAPCVAQVASATNDVAGDGTTTATVLTRAILVEGCKSVAAGMNPMDLRRGINLAVSGRQQAAGGGRQW